MENLKILMDFAIPINILTAYIYLLRILSSFTLFDLYKLYKERSNNPITATLKKTNTFKALSCFLHVQNINIPPEQILYAPFV